MMEAGTRSSNSFAGEYIVRSFWTFLGETGRGEGKEREEGNIKVGELRDHVSIIQ